DGRATAHTGSRPLLRAGAESATHLHYAERRIILARAQGKPHYKDGAGSIAATEPGLQLRLDAQVQPARSAVGELGDGDILRGDPHRLKERDLPLIHAPRSLPQHDLTQLARDMSFSNQSLVTRQDQVAGLCPGRRT